LLEASPEPTWVAAAVEGHPTPGVLNTTLLGSGRPLRISLPGASSRLADAHPVGELGVGQTIVAEGADRLNDADKSLVALRVVPAVIGSFADVDR
jgi:hypothetical protein